MPQDDLYEQAAAAFGPALERLARSYEADADARRDLLQEVHFAVWRSLRTFETQCSLRTWVYRVAHNVAVSHVLRRRRFHSRPFVALEEIELPDERTGVEAAIERQDIVERLYALIRQLDPLDRQVILLYLEGTDAASIAEITGISARNVATKIHRIKKILAGRFMKGGGHER